MHDSIIMAPEAFRALTDNLCLRLLSFRASRTRSIQLSTSTFSDKTEHHSLFARLSLQRLDVLAGEPHPLAGKGIWYGRIEPKHVQGLVDETILGGKVVADHFRGGIDRNGDILRM